MSDTELARCDAPALSALRLVDPPACTITWANKPAAVGLYGCKKISATGWVTWDVTSLVKAQSAGDGVVSLVLADSTDGNKMTRFDSRDGEKAPVIAVD